MSLSAWEQQALDSIKDELTGSDPGLAALLATFTRLASDEAMPVRARIRPGSRRTSRSRRYRSQATASTYSARGRRRPDVQSRIMLLLLLVLLLTTVGIIVVALVFSHGGNPGTGSCMGSWPTICTHPAAG